MRIVVLILLAQPFLGYGQKPGIRPGLAVPYYIEQTRIVGDTSVANATDLQVYKLFDSKIDRIIRFGMLLLNGVNVCNDNGLALQVAHIRFTIKARGVEVYESRSTCETLVPYTGFTTNREAKENKNGEVEIIFVTEKKRYEIGAVKMMVDRQQMICDDTGHNPVTLTYQGKSLYFKDIGNVAFFEADVDDDKNKEIYLLDYATCQEQLKIYKISGPAGN